MDTIEISFVNKGKAIELPLIRVSDVRALQNKRAKVTDADTKELESSVALVYSVLKRIDSSVTEDQIIDWDYASFLEFVKKLWEKNAENFRGTLPELPTKKK